MGQAIQLSAFHHGARPPETRQWIEGLPYEALVDVIQTVAQAQKCDSDRDARQLVQQALQTISLELLTRRVKPIDNT